MTAIGGVTEVGGRVAAEAARLGQETVATAHGAANKAQGKDKMDGEDYVNIMIPQAYGEALNVADTPKRDWAFPASPLERLLNEPSPLDRFGSG